MADTQPFDTPEIAPQDARDNSLWAVVAYFGPLCLLTLLLRRRSPFARYHAAQGLTLFLVQAGGAVLTALLRLVPGARLVAALLGPGLTLVWLVLAVLGVLHAVKGEAAPLPLVGHWTILH